jgi:hypothetical protein
LRSTFGSSSPIYLGFVVLGFPFGLFFLDILMFLEPFGLLATMPLPSWMKQFLPAYKATRVIAEVVIESLPQSMLQAFIYVSVVFHTSAVTQFCSGSSDSIGLPAPGVNWIRPDPRSVTSPSSASRRSRVENLP